MGAWDAWRASALCDIVSSWGALDAAKARILATQVLVAAAEMPSPGFRRLARIATIGSMPPVAR
jgi:hypothetical protein